MRQPPTSPARDPLQAGPHGSDAVIVVVNQAIGSKVPPASPPKALAALFFAEIITSADLYTNRHLLKIFSAIMMNEGKPNDNRRI